MLPPKNSFLVKRPPEIIKKVKIEPRLQEPMKLPLVRVSEPMSMSCGADKSELPVLSKQTIQSILVDFFVGLDYNDVVGKPSKNDVNYRTDDTKDSQKRKELIFQLVEIHNGDPEEVVFGKKISEIIFHTMDADKIKSTQSRINANFTKIMNLLKSHFKDKREFEDPTKDTQKLLSDHEKFNKYVKNIKEFIQICIEFIYKQIQARLNVKWIINCVEKVHSPTKLENRTSKPQCPWTLYDMLRAMLALIQKYYIPKMNKLMQNSDTACSSQQKILDKLTNHRKQYQEFLAHFAANKQNYCELGKKTCLQKPFWQELKAEIAAVPINLTTLKESAGRKGESSKKTGKKEAGKRKASQLISKKCKHVKDITIKPYVPLASSCKTHESAFSLHMKTESSLARSQLKQEFIGHSEPQISAVNSDIKIGIPDGRSTDNSIVSERLRRMVNEIMARNLLLQNTSDRLASSSR
jgi:hypothetical protein